MFAALLAVAYLADACVLPASPGRLPVFRSLAGALVLSLVLIAGCGLLMVLVGNPLAAALVMAGICALLAAVSNAKWKALGEPLLFSDFALLAAVFRHPQFYFSALAPWQRMGLLLLVPVIGPLLVWLVLNGSLAARGYGLAIFCASAIVTWFSLRLPLWGERRIRPMPRRTYAGTDCSPRSRFTWCAGGKHLTHSPFRRSHRGRFRAG